MQAFEELERLLGEEDICLAVKAKLTKDSGVAGASAYEHIVDKLQAKPNATGKQAGVFSSITPSLDFSHPNGVTLKSPRVHASSLYSLHFAPPPPNYPCIHPYSHTLWNRSSALHGNERGANPIFTLDSHLITYCETHAKVL